MADVRALLAAEKQSRRIVHPHLTYSKSGALTCNVCNLNVKSEQLWPGHLKSANHRKNALNSQEPVIKPLKRKLDDIEDGERGQDRNYEVDNRKKPKAITEKTLEQGVLSPNGSVQAPKHAQMTEDPGSAVTVSAVNLPSPTQAESTSNPKQDVEAVDEDEWAAFERDIKPLAQPDYATATITAAPVSASDVAAQAEKEKRQTREQEAEDEKEDESRRMEEEFDVMEEMEERMRRLREKREAVRHPSTTVSDTGQDKSQDASVDDGKQSQSLTSRSADNDDDNDDDSNDESDDWYA